MSADDYETCIEGGVCPTLNVFDNNGDTRATVLIMPVLMRWREGKPGGGQRSIDKRKQIIDTSDGK